MASILYTTREDSVPTEPVPQLAGLGRFASNPTQSGFESSRNLLPAGCFGSTNEKGRHFLWRTLFHIGGPEKIRTPCLLSANEALYQVSYGPFVHHLLLTNYVVSAGYDT